MKQVILLSFFSFFSSKTIVLPKVKKDKVFYFCDSGAWDRKDFSAKQVVQYAEIKEAVDNKDSIWKLTVQWGTLAHKRCENASGCTADLNSYPTYDAAKTEYDKMIKKYSDTSRYIIRKRSF